MVWYSCQCRRDQRCASTPPLRKPIDPVGTLDVNTLTGHCVTQCVDKTRRVGFSTSAQPMSFHLADLAVISHKDVIACEGEDTPAARRLSDRKRVMLLQDAEEDVGHSGAHSSAAWCLSAVLLFLSLLLLRQAFVPSNSPNASAAAATALGGQNRHIAKGLDNAYLQSNSSATLILLPLESGLDQTVNESEVTPP